ncbi:sterol-binding domain protein [Oleiphilus messinensis]|uniref:Ubiquinone biosynthesis accessory factor UbiJ n=1 Tax=Oleiphilus messinensis TaxID=141451 RepID=A0A1Y0I4F9_9GAMM|nr:SCP2 sterol-binding domain-containing protein [Oleiphilus messinensis]ARU55089.1 sterol-binding domain protein [Oleiphilus messinensis]
MSYQDPAALSLLLEALEGSLNKALELDPAAKSGFQQHADRIIEVRSGPVKLIIRPLESGKLSLQRHWDAEVDATIRGKPLDLARMALSKDKLAVIQSTHSIEIEGDLSLIEAFQKIISTLDIDWEQALAEVIGDVPAHFLGQRIRSGMKWGKQAQESMLANIEEYLQEEGRQTPAKSEFEHTAKAIESLSLAADRLEARIRKLKRQLDDTPLQKNT